ncbi:VOC family protein [Spongiivirga citrea]|uniref:VOC family protein n=1 Tax=Spongiivirga citrea TaxID=1481457 RepID=A0A6M0CTS3_9FLAO|nr:VOC family protein [Spongiivirga citrea]NER17190.1 VOC family protein [Spongiivirga citrea]
MEQRMTIIGLGVNDLKVSTAFYEQKFGWKKTNASNESISFFQLNGILLSLYPKDKLAEDAEVSPEGSGFKAFSLAHNTKTEQEVDTIVNELRSKGVKIVKEPQKVFWGGYSSYVADPDDNLWEIAYNPFLELDDKGNAVE